MTLIEAVRTTMRRLHYSPRTEEAYVHWTREFVRFHGRRGHQDVRTTMIYTHIVDRGPLGVVSPLDR